MRLEGKVAIVTGGARGIGRAYALGLAGEGARVAVADINLPGAEEVVKEIKERGGDGLALFTDVTDEKSTLKMAKKTADAFGRIDILMNNAGFYHDMACLPFDQTSPEEWDKVMAVNLKGLFLCCRAVFPWMKAQHSGKIITVASGTVFGGVVNMIHYVTSKAGVIGFTRALAREVGPYNICVNCIAPGLTDTEASRNILPEAVQDDRAKLRCFKRREVAEDLVGTVIFLSCSDSDFMTGQTVNVDGGMNMH